MAFSNDSKPTTNRTALCGYGPGGRSLVERAESLPLVRVLHGLPGVVVRLPRPAAFHHRPQSRNQRAAAARHSAGGAQAVGVELNGDFRRGLGDWRFVLWRVGRPN